MKLPNDESPLCALCKKRPAVKRYTHTNLDERVCAICFDRWSLQHEYERAYPHIDALEQGEQYDEALACLDTILEANRSRDHDAWLARSIGHERAMILFEAGRYAEAEQAFRARERLGFADVSQRWMHADGTARTLEALGRDREAVTVLEEALGHEDPRFLPSVIWVLTGLVRLLEKIGQPVDAKWLRIAEAVAERYGVDMPIHDSPGEAILALDVAIRGKQPKRRSE